MRFDAAAHPKMTTDIGWKNVAKHWMLPEPSPGKQTANHRLGLCCRCSQEIYIYKCNYNYIYITLYYIKCSQEIGRSHYILFYFHPFHRTTWIKLTIWWQNNLRYHVTLGHPPHMTDIKSHKQSRGKWLTAGSNNWSFNPSFWDLLTIIDVVCPWRKA